MNNLKRYQYANVSKQSAMSYSGKLAVVLTDDSAYDVLTPVNTTDNSSQAEDTLILVDTLSNQGD